MKKLNREGFGMPNSPLKLHLVYNPVGAFLPGSQSALAYEYKKKLREEYDIHFSELFCIANNPIGRFLDFLLRTDNFTDYMESLSLAFNPMAAQNAMCRTTLSVGWDGTLYDCDFNQMLEMKVNHGAPHTIANFDFDKLRNRRIRLHNHCYACTAGAGSSCQGATQK
jgi:radical SAM/Cys-rich protein